MRQVLVTGATGQVGTALARHAWRRDWEAVTLDRAELDLCEPASVVARIAERSWAAVINTAAFTDVDRAQIDPVIAWQVNAVGPAALAAACHACGVPIVHVSTDYVFAGDKADAWHADDPTDPVGVYGASKLAGELAVRTGCPRHAIVRTAWVVSAHGRNFVRTMLRLGAERGAVRVVADQRGSPTSATDLAAALATIAMQLADDPTAPTGTFHFTNSGPTDWASFAETIFAEAARRGAPACRVQRIATADYPTPARRPANSLLSTAAIEAAYGIHARPWRDALGDILNELLGSPRA